MGDDDGSNNNACRNVDNSSGVGVDVDDGGGETSKVNRVDLQ